jgi:predicted HTH transcriptional regulator
MTAEELFREQLKKVEGPTIDFKREHYEKAKRHEFIKDVLAMANTPREEAAYIVLGVDIRRATGVKDLVGLPQQEDDTYYVNLLGPDNVSPLPKIEYIPVSFDSKLFGILKIGVSEGGPFLPTKDLEGLKQGNGGCGGVP